MQLTCPGMRFAPVGFMTTMQVQFGPQETAAEHVCTSVPIAGPLTPLGVLRDDFRRRRFECAGVAVVCENDRLKGLIRIEDLLAAPDHALARDIMDPDPPVVAPGVDQERVAWKAVQHGESTIAVVDGQGVFQGIIPAHRLLAVLLWEHEEDMARLSGTATAQSATVEPTFRRLWHRAPWLLVGLFGALLASDLVGVFAADLEASLVLAFFLPGIVYLADAVGTQTETLIVRGLSVGVSIRQIVYRESATGLLLGLGMALLAFPFSLWRWGQWDLAWTVSLSLLAACGIATVVAMILPWSLSKLGVDPAFGSGPLATVIQDLLSIAIYFGVAGAIMR